MANKFDGYLGNTITGDKGTLGDYQHASRLYVDDNFRLAPKVKFLYYVVFNINPNVAPDLQSKAGLELNYLVRSSDLPKFQIDTEPFYQYNRKAHIYKKINYMPINMVMHDDNYGNVNSLWASYYGYYFGDRNNNYGPYGDVFPAAYQSHTYHNKSRWPFQYGLDNGSKSREPFFYSIQLFTINRHQFNSYLLCLPKITQWDHDAVNQDESAGTINHKLSIIYDAVLYSNGTIQQDDPTGWAVLHYDNIPSPLVNEYNKEGVEGVFGDVRTNDLLNKYPSNSRSRYPYDLDRGNRTPFGYGSRSFYGNSPYQQAGGLNGIAFGLAAGAASGLINAGIGLLNGAFDNSGNDGLTDSNNSNQSQNQTDENGVASPSNPSGDNNNRAAAKDVYDAPNNGDNPSAATDNNTGGFNTVRSGTGPTQIPSGDGSSGNSNSAAGNFGSPAAANNGPQPTAASSLADKVSSAGTVDQVAKLPDGTTITTYQKDGFVSGSVTRDANGNVKSAWDDKGNRASDTSLSMDAQAQPDTPSPNPEAAAAADSGENTNDVAVNDPVAPADQVADADPVIEDNSGEYEV